MKKIIVQIIISLALVFSSILTLFGQEKIIHGKVTTFNKIPLINARIIVKSTKEVVFSDTLGQFTVLCSPKDKLKVTAKGFSNQNVKIEDQVKLVLVNLKLNPVPKNRDLDIGYGHISDRDKLDAVSSLNDQDLGYSYYSDVYDIIKGRFPGVDIRGNEIIIRGGTTVMGSDAALLILDGLEVDSGTLRSIPTTDISSVNVLKGPAATIYGSSGANGVVIVTTKGGDD
jgi:TonB-dependent SusC/RagA subfamily outer membrane receptor